MPNARPQGAAPAFLASVTDVEEACGAFVAGADVIDCKDPASGALGRLDPAVVRDIVKAVSHLAPVSATIGDTFADDAQRVAAAEEMADTGVAIVKCGFFGEAGDAAAAAALGRANLGTARLFAVLMADRIENFSLVPHLAANGFIGVMLDTADKRAGALPQIMAAERLEAFLAIAHAYQLAAGLAGSLREADIVPLVALRPDVLGFRGALCIEGRQGKLDETRVAAVRGAIDRAAGVELKRSVA